MAVSQSDIDEAHSQGQKDGYNNVYQPPVGFWKRTLGFTSEDEYELIAAYDRGYGHGRSQR
jgi:hypothetical protein